MVDTIIKSDENINFDEQTHVYTRNNIPYISVTELLKKYNLSANYANIPQQVLANAAQRGTYVHSVLENYIKKGIILDSAVLDPFIKYITNRQIDLSTAISEEKVYNDKYQVAGTIDFQFIDGNDIIIADFKTTSQVHWDAVVWQLSIYNYLKYGGDILEYYTKRLQVFHIIQNQLTVSEVNLIPMEEVEKLLEANLSGTSYVYTPDYSNIMTMTESSIYRQIHSEIEIHERYIKQLKDKLNLLDKRIIESMNNINLHTFTQDNLRFKLSTRTGATTLDVKKIKEFFDQNNISILPYIKKGTDKVSLICTDLNKNTPQNSGPDISQDVSDLNS